MKLSRNLKIRLITSFLNRVASFAIVPFMTIFFVTTFGLKMAGIIGVIQVVISYATNLIGGYFGDTYDAQQLIFYGQITQAIIQFSIGMVILWLFNPWIIMVLYFINIIASNMYKSTFSSLLIASVNDQNKKKAYMFDYASVNISLALGVSIGSLLFGKYQYVVFMLSAVIILMVALILHYGFSYDRIAQNNRKTKYFSLKTKVMSLVKGYSIPFKDTQFLKYVLGTALVMASPLALETLGQVHFNQAFSTKMLMDLHLRNGTQLFGLIQIENVIIVVIGTLIFSKFVNNVKKTTIVIMLVAYIASYNVVYNTTNVGIIVCMILIGSVAELGYAAFVQSMQVELIPNDHRAKYLSLNSFSNYVSQLIGSLGLILLSVSNMFVATSILSLISLIGVYLIIKIKVSVS